MHINIYDELFMPYETRLFELPRELSTHPRAMMRRDRLSSTRISQRVTAASNSPTAATGESSAPITNPGVCTPGRGGHSPYRVGSVGAGDVPADAGYVFCWLITQATHTVHTCAYQYL